MSKPFIFLIYNSILNNKLYYTVNFIFFLILSLTFLFCTSYVSSIHGYFDINHNKSSVLINYYSSDEVSSYIVTDQMDLALTKIVMTQAGSDFSHELVLKPSLEKGEVQGYLMRGVSDLKNNKHISLVKGEYPKEQYLEVIIPSQFAKNNALSIDSYISMAGKDYRISGIFESNEQVYLASIVSTLGMLQSVYELYGLVNSVRLFDLNNEKIESINANILTEGVKIVNSDSVLKSQNVIFLIFLDKLYWLSLVIFILMAVLGGIFTASTLSNPVNDYYESLLFFSLDSSFISKTFKKEVLMVSFIFFTFTLSAYYLLLFNSEINIQGFFVGKTIEFGHPDILSIFLISIYVSIFSFISTRQLNLLDKRED